MKTNQNSMSTGISYLIAVVIYGTALTNADQDRKRGLISMLLQVIIDLDHGNSRKSIRASSYYTSLAVGKFWCSEKSKSMLRFESRANTEATTKLVLLIVIKVATSSSGTVAWIIQGSSSIGQEAKFCLKDQHLTNLHGLEDLPGLAKVL